MEIYSYFWIFEYFWILSDVYSLVYFQTLNAIWSLLSLHYPSNQYVWLLRALQQQLLAWKNPLATFFVLENIFDKIFSMKSCMRVSRKIYLKQHATHMIYFSPQVEVVLFAICLNGIDRWHFQFFAMAEVILCVTAIFISIFALFEINIVDLATRDLLMSYWDLLRAHNFVHHPLK